MVTNMAYSLDLRARAIEYFESGNTKLATSQVFNVHEQTLRKWVLLKAETGALEPREHGGGAPSRVSQEALKAYIEEHPNAILETMSKHFEMTIPGIAYHLHKHGYVQKKV